MTYKLWLSMIDMLRVTRSGQFTEEHLNYGLFFLTYPREMVWNQKELVPFLPQIEGEGRIWYGHGHVEELNAFLGGLGFACNIPSQSWGRASDIARMLSAQGLPIEVFYDDRG